MPEVLERILTFLLWFCLSIVSFAVIGCSTGLMDQNTTELAIACSTMFGLVVVLSNETNKD